MWSGSQPERKPIPITYCKRTLPNEPRLHHVCYTPVAPHEGRAEGGLGAVAVVDVPLTGRVCAATGAAAAVPAAPTAGGGPAASSAASLDSSSACCAANCSSIAPLSSAWADGRACRSASASASAAATAAAASWGARVRGGKEGEESSCGGTGKCMKRHQLRRQLHGVPGAR
ncbi:hypothetical protein TSOC_011607 [Tetrabaena socialis]|uniref:Uncharacterized protein n=1 Tax=Tetrabaena socialis TaxID=47790 RepID=A0A2J7ZQB2_9CHLO|nr:hypothetical protein TSOC_011607 [Tetrabaena socialis]|eukprot:PNH02450.1 hypothetical protein TSOC_011607 [Tetrabaena socialis]